MDNLNNEHKPNGFLEGNDMNSVLHESALTNSRKQSQQYDDLATMQKDA